MKFSAEVMPTAVGTYGPFKDDEGTAREGRTIPFLAFVALDGGESERATAAEGVELASLALMQPVELVFELYRADSKLKLRTLGRPAAVAAPSAVPEAA